MFGAGSNPFGQSSSSPFGSPSVFGQNSNATSNPFAPKPFGSTTPFGTQTGSSMFGGTSTGVFGMTQPSSHLTTTPTFGASSTPSFGSSAFGASSTPAFGSSSSTSFGSSSVFGQKPTFGAFGSSGTQANPFGNTFQQSQSAFGNSSFGSTTPFGAASQPAFGASSSPAFGSTPTGFSVSSTPGFGSGGAFGQTSTPAFGASSTPAFGATSSPAFGAPSTSAFGGSSAPSFSFGSSPAFGQSTSAFGGSPNPSPFGTSTTPFGSQSTPFGAQAQVQAATSTPTPAFGSTPFGQQPGFGGQRGGSRATPYAPATDTDTQPPGKLVSISAMTFYKDKSHEELRWEDHQLGDKGGPSPANQSAGTNSFGGTTITPQANPFAATSSFGQASSSPFTSTTVSNPFAAKTPGFGAGFGSSPSPSFASSPFGASTTSNLFGSTSSPAPSIFGANTSASLFGSTSSMGFGSSPSASIFGQAPASTPAFGTGLSFASTQPSPLFQSSTPSLGQTSVFGQSGSSFGQSSAPAFGQTSLFSAPSTGFGGNMFSSTPLQSSNLFGQSTPSLSTPVQQAQPVQSSFGFGTFGQSQPATGTTLYGSTPNAFFGQSSATQISAPVQSVPVANPFGTLPTMPQMSIGRNGNAPSVQYGISSLPVDKPVPGRISSLLTSRHISHRRIRLPARKYHPKSGAQMVPFFSEDEEPPSTPKADALFVPRENPRALVIRPVDQWPSRLSIDKSSPLTTAVQENGKTAERASTVNGSVTENGDIQHPVANGGIKDQNHRPPKTSTPKPNGIHEESPKEDSYITLTSHRAGEAAIVYEHGAGIEAMMPKLRHSDYYTEPRIQELAAKERAEPGFCRNVKSFIIGRHGYGNIMFIGETDVRRLDLESLVQFNNREVIVYLDESKKPPVGQGLNKPAEVTLLNIKCFDKKTGQQVTDGPRIDKYKEMLKKKANEQGAEFVSYDSVKGEWKFRVKHFSSYGLESS